MRTRAALPGAIVLAVLAVGCATPTPQDLQTRDLARAEAERLLASFAGALRGRDAQALVPLLAPHLRPREVRMLQGKLTGASWLEFYAGYDPALAKPIADVSWRDWQKGEARVTVSYATVHKEKTRDVFTLVRSDGQWRIFDFEVKEPQPEDLLNVPEDTAVLLGGKAAELLQLLREGHFMDVFYQLPDEPSSRYRRAKASWWRRLISDAPKVVHLLSDLERMQEFTVLDWPRRQEVAFAYAPGNGVAAFFEVPYVWPEAGIDETDLLRVEFVFLRREEGWAFYQMRFVGEGIPWSK